MNFTGHSEKRTRDIPLPFQWPVWLPTPSSPLLLVSELRQAPQALRIWAHIGAHHSCRSLICPLLGAAHRLWNGAGSLPRMGAVSTWGKGWNRSPLPCPWSTVPQPQPWQRLLGYAWGLTAYLPFLCLCHFLPPSLPFFYVPIPLCPLLFSPCTSGHTSVSLKVEIRSVLGLGPRPLVWSSPFGKFYYHSSSS